MPQVSKIDWTTFDPVFRLEQVEAGGFAEIDGVVPMEIALMMMRGLEAYTAKRSTASKQKRPAASKTKRVGKKPRTN